MYNLLLHKTIIILTKNGDSQNNGFKLMPYKNVQIAKTLYYY